MMSRFRYVATYMVIMCEHFNYVKTGNTQLVANTVLKKTTIT